MPEILTLLRIKNLALVEELEWQMGPGFVAVTGERRLAGEQVVQHGPEAVEVAAHRRRLAEARALGRHVGHVA